MKLFVLSFLILISFQASAFAKKIALFKCSPKIDFADNYDNLIYKIRPGDKIDLCNGEVITVEKELGRGNSAIVYAIKEDESAALRIPLSKKAGNMMLETVRGEKILAAHKVPHVRLISTKRKYWAKVDRIIDGDTITYSEFERMNDLKKQQKLFEKFEEFCLKTIEFEWLGDLHRENIVYVKSRGEWVIMDWTNAHSMWNPRKAPDHYKHPMNQIWSHADLNDRYKGLSQKISMYRDELSQLSKRDFQKWIDAKICSPKLKKN